MGLIRKALDFLKAEEPVFCKDCEHCIPADYLDGPISQLYHSACAVTMDGPEKTYTNFQTGEIHTVLPDYVSCRIVNKDGRCPKFSPKVSQ